MLARLPVRSTFLTGALAALACALAPAGASAAIPWQACSTAGFECAGVPVPVNRAGDPNDAITLSVARVKAATNPNNVAVVPLAGGPGQAALPLKQTFAQVLQPAIADRDLLVFDQRGTGSSGALSCPALGRSSGSILKIAAACAGELGARRAFFRTADSVADIEALRVAGGYAKLVLFGVSYGTKVAEDYAAAYPQNVEALVLDSVVLPEGPDPFQRSTLTSAPRVLRDLCAGNACSRATDNVTRDLSSMASKLRKGSLRGKVVLSSGRRTSLSMDQTDLLAILLAGDLNPTLRAELPGSMRAALRGDSAPLLRLAVRSEGLTTGLQADESSSGDSDALFLTTTCEEAPFAWTRTASAEQRYDEITAAAQAIPKAQLGPFSPSAALKAGPIPFCLGWPDASPAPPASPPLPAVRTLVLDGQMDLRTPYEDASQIAARIPGAIVVQVPFTGHSTVSADMTKDSACTKTALATFFAGGTPGACTASSNPYSPTPRPPTTFRTIKQKGATRKTVSAAVNTVYDAYRQLIGDVLALNALPRHVAGLRGGNATVNKHTSLTLNRYQYVKGVVVSGKIAADGSARVTIHGGGALRGSLRIATSGSVTGTLGGKHVSFGVSAAARQALPTVAEVLARPGLLARR